MLGTSAVIGFGALALSPRSASAQEAAPISAGPTSGGSLDSGFDLGGNRPTATPPNLANGAGLDYVDPSGKSVVLNDGTIVILPLGVIPNVGVTGDPSKPSVTVTYSADGTTVTITVDGKGGGSFTYEKKDGNWTYTTGADGKGGGGGVKYKNRNLEVEFDVYANDESAGFDAVVTIPLGPNPNQ